MKSTFDGPSGTVQPSMEDTLRELGFELAQDAPLGPLWAHENEYETVYVYQDVEQKWCYEFSMAKFGIEATETIADVKKYLQV